MKKPRYIVQQVSVCDPRLVDTLQPPGHTVAVFPSGYRLSTKQTLRLARRVAKLLNARKNKSRARRRQAVTV